MKKFPLIKRKPAFYPTKRICAFCRKSNVCEPNSFAVLNGGALVADKPGNAFPSKSIEGFLELTWHGAHDDGIGRDREKYCRIPLSEDVQHGQFEFYFCSIRCLRQFLNQWVDELENRVKKSAKLKTGKTKSK